VTALAIAFRRVRARDADLAGLDERERSGFSALAAPRRRAEYAAGRAAARAALARLLGGAAEGAAVVPARGTGGRPIPVDARGRPLSAQVTITHAGGLAAAAASLLPVGLDLVALEPLGPGFREEAFTEGEIACWERWMRVTPGAPPGACAAFAAKEAVLKWLGMGLDLPLHAVRVAPAGPGVPARLAGTVAALAFPLRVEAARTDVLLDAWIAGSARRVLLAVCGEG
jgi:phosphopantetheinyl transferase